MEYKIPFNKEECKCPLCEAGIPTTEYIKIDIIDEDGYPSYFMMKKDDAIRLGFLEKDVNGNYYRVYQKSYIIKE